MLLWFLSACVTENHRNVETFDECVAALGEENIFIGEVGDHEGFDYEAAGMGDGFLDISDFCDGHDARGIDGAVRLAASSRDLSALSCLVCTSGAVIVKRGELDDLSGLESLRVIEGTLLIQENDNLVDVSALHGVNGIGGDISVWENPALAESAIDELLGAIGRQNVSGDIDVR